MDQDLGFAHVALHMTQMLVAWGLLFVLLIRATRDRKVGEPILVNEQREPWRPALLGAQAGLLAICLASEDFPRTQAVLALGLGMALLKVMPGWRDSAVGKTGVSSGWVGSLWLELDEWRLTGEHLRYRVRDEWRAVFVPRREQARVRALLAQHVADRESEFAT